MSASENRRQYLAWMRTNFPSLYNATVNKVVSDHLTRQTGLGSLGDDFGTDFFANMTPTPTGYADTSSSYVDNSGDSSIFSSIADSAGSLFNTILGTAAKVAPAYVNTSSQLQLLQINSDRAKQGLPPLTYLNGQQVTAAGLAPANPSVNGVENALSTVPSSFLWFGGFTVLGLLLYKALSGRGKK